MAPTASRMLKESHVSRASKQPEEPPAGHFSEPQDGGPSGVQVSVQHAPPGGDSTVMPLIEGSALVTHQPELSFSLGGNVIIDVQQTDGEVATGHAEREPSPSYENQDIHVPTSSSGLFL